MTDGVQYPAFTESTMYGDTASLYHLTDGDSDIYDVVVIIDKFSGIGGVVNATKKGKKWDRYICDDGSSIEIESDPVKFSIDDIRLFAITLELSKGAKISNNEQNDLILT